MACNCKNSINNYVDLSELDPQPWEDGEYVVALDECGRLVLIKRPTDVISEEDREKLDALEVDEDGNLTNVVMYNESSLGLVNPVNLKGDIILNNNRKIFGRDTNGALFNLVELNEFDIPDFGSNGHHFNINSIDRPTVQLPGETGAQSHPIAYQSEVNEVQTNLDNETTVLENQINAITADLANYLRRGANEGNITSLATSWAFSTSDTLVGLALSAGLATLRANNINFTYTGNTSFNNVKYLHNVVLTQSEYDAIITKDPDTIYFITV
jgi:hypothetical protein